MNKKWVRWIVAGSVCLLIKIFSLFPLAVERVYSGGFYPRWAAFQRILLGWLPISIGDLLYLAAGIYLLMLVIRLTHITWHRRWSRQIFTIGLLKFIWAILMIYIVFNLFWGLNYNRVPILEKEGITVTEYSDAELKDFMQLLHDRLDSFYVGSRHALPLLPTKRALFNASELAYDNARSKYSFLDYHHPSVKPSLFSYLGNFLGFTGYYNPFTGEAQVNTTVPLFVQPFTTCHEIGHQLGFAKENEANFAGVLSASRSPDSSFRYSVYFDLYTYGLRDLYYRDSTAAIALNKSLAPGVKNDIRTLRRFYVNYANPFEPMIRALYGKYLKANEQPTGIRSYNQVVLMMIAYMRKHGKNAI